MEERQRSGSHHEACGHGDWSDGRGQRHDQRRGQELRRRREDRQAVVVGAEWKLLNQLFLGQI